MTPETVLLEARKHGLEVDFVNYGIASRIDNTILMNINIVKYPTFCKSTLDHEIRHTPIFNKHNLMMDFFEGSIIDNLKFCFRHPFAFSQFIPIARYNGVWAIDVNQIIVYFIGLFIIGVWLLLVI